MFERIKDVDHPEEQMLSVFREYGVVAKDSRDNINKTAENRSIYQLVHPGWLVANRMKAWQGSVGISSLRGIVSGHYICFAPRHSEDARYLNWLLRSTTYTNGYALLSRGVRIGQAEIDNDEFRLMPILLPPLGEQRAIADYLDRETARIDTLIEEQQRLIEMLRERRQDLIRAAILGSANPFSPPAEAAFTAIGHHFSVTLGKMLDAGKAVRAEDRLLPYIRAGNIQDAGLKLDDVKEMPYSEAEAANLNLLKGDLLVVEGGAVGTNALVREDMPGWSFQKTVNRLRPLGNWSSAWLGYVLRTYRDIGVIDIVCNKSTIPHLTAEKLRAMRIPSVDPQEQVLVAARLDRQTIKIDVLIEETARFIELSRERRSALITAAVTGQFDVGEAA
ncbi:MULTISPECIES: restriction endonuclease subunit S [unclassified Frankia]|nr:MULTISPECIES: restriction endonuclease subunit S [unclassified Frankia]